MKRHIILVGLPGSGKSTVGRLLAMLLETSFVDVDARIVQQTGNSIEHIFEEQGEPAFRSLEREEVKRALGEPAGVIAPGGGWIAQPGALGDVAERAFLIYLETDPATAAARAAAGTRPLLVGGDPVVRMKELLTARAESYAGADATLNTGNRTPGEVAALAAELARSRAGW